MIQSFAALILIALSFYLGFVVGTQRARSGKMASHPQTVEDILRQELASGDHGDLSKDEFQFFDKLTAKSLKQPVAAKEPKPRVPVQETVSPAEMQVSQEKETTSEKTSTADVKAAFTLQLASFKTKDRAELMVGELKKQNLNAFVTSVDLGEKGVWYRVKLGQYSTQEEAANAARTLRDQTGKDSFITRLAQDR